MLAEQLRRDGQPVAKLSLLGVEPVATGQDLRRMVKALGPRKSFWTGVSAPLQIGRASPDEVRRAVRDAFDVFGREGFLLSAVPTIRRHWPRGRPRRRRRWGIIGGYGMKSGTG